MGESSDARAPFHPLRFVDLLRENWKQQVILWPAMIGIGWLAVWVPENVVRGVFALVLIGFLLAITPRATMYGRPVGTWPSGELYDRWFKEDT